MVDIFRHIRYIKTQVNSICEIINAMATKKDIKALIFSGKYCYHEILISLMKNSLHNLNIYFLVSSPPYLAKLWGAVIFGINPSNYYNVRKKAKFILYQQKTVLDEKEYSKKMNIKFEDFKNQLIYDNEIGGGAYGTVYKITIGNEKYAVKKINLKNLTEKEITVFQEIEPPFF